MMHNVIHKIMWKIAGRLPCYLIYVDGTPSLERYYIGSAFGMSFYLDRFVSNNPYPYLHNLPWERSLSVVLTGNYEEEEFVDFFSNTMGAKIKKIQLFSYSPGNRFHRIISVSPNTWTFFVHNREVAKGGQRKGWGHLEKNKDGTIYFREITEYLTPKTMFKHAPLGFESNREAM